MNKRGADAWISYVLLVGFTVALAAFMYSWMTGFSSDKSIEIKERVYNVELCDSLSVSVTACNVSSQALNINVTNRGDIRINQLIFRQYSINGTDYFFTEKNITIKPGNTESFSNFPNNITNVIVDVIPATIKDKFLIVCTERKAMASNIASC